MGLINKFIKVINQNLKEKSLLNSKQIVCKACGAIQNEKTRYCSDCGAEMTNDVYYDDNIPTIDSKEKQDYATAIFLYANSNSKIKNNNEYVGYLFYECGISNPKKYHQELINEGYLKQASINEILYNFKLDDLKKILKENNLKVTGKKAELIDRISSELSEKELNKINFDRNIYTLSEKGKKYIENHKDYIEIHRHSSWQITLEEYIKVKRQLNFSVNFNDIAWGIFNKRTMEYSNNKQYGLQRNNYYNMFQLLIEEKKEMQAFEMIVKVIIYDLSSVNTLEDIKLYKDGIYSKEDLLNSYSDIFLAPGIIKELLELEQFYSDKLVKTAYKQVILPINFCSETILIELMNEVFHNAIFDYEKYIDKINLERIKYLKNL